MQEVIEYIKTILTYGDIHSACQIGYTDNKEEWHRYNLIIIPSESILNERKATWHEPDLTKELTPQICDGKWVISEDIIYNTAYCISLADEFCIVHEAADIDMHNRMISQATTLGKAALRTSPIIDEYSTICSKILQKPIFQGISNIALTHDVDTITHFRRIRGFVGGLYRGQLTPALKSVFKGLENDTAYTFPWLLNQDNKIPTAEKIYFIKATNGKGYDYPQYKLQSRDFHKVLTFCRENAIKVGLHGSYYADNEFSYGKEKAILEAVIKEKITLHRNHYLHTTSAEALQAIADSGITDDYTMGWADHIGFRYASTRPVRWINPKTKRLTSLTLHPQSIMDCTLSNDNYMNIQSKKEAFDRIKEIIETVSKYHGELVLLWHNSNVQGDNYHRELYSEVTDYLSKV